MRVIVLDDDGTEMLNISARYDDATMCLFPGQDDLSTVRTCLLRALALVLPSFLPGEPQPEMNVVAAVDATEEKPERPPYLRLVEPASNDA